MAAIIEEKDIPVDRIYKISERHSWALDFYNQYPVRIATPNELRDLNNIWIYATEEELKLLSMAGIFWDQEYKANQFRITRLQGKFLNPTTRPSVINNVYLLHKQ